MGSALTSRRGFGINRYWKVTSLKDVQVIKRVLVGYGVNVSYLCTERWLIIRRNVSNALRIEYFVIEKRCTGCMSKTMLKSQDGNSKIPSKVPRIQDSKIHPRIKKSNRECGIAIKTLFISVLSQT